LECRTAVSRRNPGKSFFSGIEKRFILAHIYCSIQKVDMKKLVIVIWATCFCFASAFAQVTKQPVTKPQTIKNNSLPTKTVTKSTEPEPIYSLTAARITVKTGNDNKEQPSKVSINIDENDGIWGQGRLLFYPSNNNEFTSEIKINSTFEFPLIKYGNVPADAFTLTNLQGKGLKFTIYYMPNFGLDAWKIESVSLQIEFKDQFGRLHPTYGNVTLQYPVTNGLLTGNKVVMVGTTDKFLMSQGVRMGETKDFW